jgi:uncharacterized protein (TIGR02118 family)
MPPETSKMIVCEIAFAPHGSAASARFAQFLRHWGNLAGLLALDVYTPAAGNAADPYVREGPASAHLAKLIFPSMETFDRASQDSHFRAGLDAMEGAVLSATAMRRSDHPVAGATAALSAPFSYVVRYHRPAEDEAAFVRHYIETHPALLAQFPGIRNVLCYIPLPWRHPHIPIADYMLGNEVVFDDIAAFNTAMASPHRHELRAHFREFPAFSGRNTHFAFDRRRVVGR